MESAYRKLGYFLLALPLIMISGFWIPYFSLIPRFDASMTAAVHVHAVLLFIWVSLLVVQPMLIRGGNLSAHRLIGKVSYVLLPVILVFAVAMVVKEYGEGLAAGKTPERARAGEYLSSCQLALLGACYLASIYHVRRHDVAAHMRFMICIALILLPAGLARTLGYCFGVGESVSQGACLAVVETALAALIAFDVRRGSAAGPYALVLAAYLPVEIGWLALGRP